VPVVSIKKVILGLVAAAAVVAVAVICAILLPIKWFAFALFVLLLGAAAALALMLARSQVNQRQLTQKSLREASATIVTKVEALQHAMDAVNDRIDMLSQMQRDQTPLLNEHLKQLSKERDRVASALTQLIKEMDPVTLEPGRNGAPDAGRPEPEKK